MAQDGLMTNLEPVENFIIQLLSNKNNLIEQLKILQSNLIKANELIKSLMTEKNDLEKELEKYKKINTMDTMNIDDIPPVVLEDEMIISKTEFKKNKKSKD